MKKILLLLSALGITTTSVSSVVACKSPAETISTEQEIYNKIKAIAAQPIEYNDLFLVNYGAKEATPKIIHELFSIMWTYNNTSTNLINQLLTKLVYEKVFQAIPNLEQLYPDFTLYTKIDLQTNVNEEMENLRKNRKFTTNYIILYNLHSLDQIDSFMETSEKDGERVTHDNSTFRAFFEGGDAYSQLAEYMIHASKTFSFKQEKFIADAQERLDFYMDLYKNTSHIKPFASDDSKNSFKMFNVADINYQKNNLPQDVITQIKNDNPEKDKYLKIIEEYIKNEWLQKNHIDQLHFSSSELEMIDSFETNLTFDSAYTETEILYDEKLNYVFGAHDGSGGNLSGFYNGILIFNLDLQAKYKNKISHQTSNEKLYVRIVNPYR